MDPVGRYALREPGCINHFPLQGACGAAVGVLAAPLRCLQQRRQPRAQKPPHAQGHGGGNWSRDPRSLPPLASSTESALYLKRVFSHEICDAQVLAADNDEDKEGTDDALAGLLAMDELPAPHEVTKPKCMRRTKPPGKCAAAMPHPSALASTQTGCNIPMLFRPQATPEPIPVPDDFDETMQAINYHFDDTAQPPLDLDLNSDLNSDLNGKASSTFGLQSAHTWSEDEGVGAFGFGPSEGSYVTDPLSSLAHNKQSPRTSGTQLDVRPRVIYRGAEFAADRSSPFERSMLFDVFSKPPPSSLLTSSLGAASMQSTSFSFPPTINSTISGVAIMASRINCVSPRTLVSPVPTPPPTGTLVAPVPTPTPAGTLVAPIPTPMPTARGAVPTPPPAGTLVVPVPPVPTPSPAGTLVAPVPTPTPAGTLVAPVPPVPTPLPARPPTPPAHVIPHYPVSCPMANVSKGHPLAAPVAGEATTPASKRKPGRPRKKPAEPAGEMGEGAAGGMTPEARAESDRIHREEAQLREMRKEMLRHGRALKERAAAALAEQYSAALLHNPAGGAPLTVIKCSSCAIKATLDPEGNPLIHPVIRTRGDVGNGGWLVLRVLGSDALQAQEDAEMLEKLSEKKAAATKKTSGAKKAVSNGGAKCKASDTIPVGETVAKKFFHAPSYIVLNHVQEAQDLIEGESGKGREGRRKWKGAGSGHRSRAGSEQRSGHGEGEGRKCRGGKREVGQKVGGRGREAGSRKGKREAGSADIGNNTYK
ncbi:hypothetical protein B0H14DRAFT_2656654 [Mycena olivaceomarginata]|nr:hypothetical protein B0H14DRAFT_2656654 [Mycena olivaceomarginata]